jgi:hypothetical protein
MRPQQDAITDNVPAADAVDNRRWIAVAIGSTLLVAGLTLVAVVLPAEYAIDPLGTGSRLGLLDLGITGRQVRDLDAAAGSRSHDRTPTVVPQDRAFTEETVAFNVAAHEAMEYKYRLDKAAALLYTWTATGALDYEFHAEPDGAPRGYAESYEKTQDTSRASGTLTAPFAGIHGWYWQNNSSQAVTITLKTAGFYHMAHEFRGGGPPTTKIFQ